MNIYGKKVLFRAIEIKDAEVLNRWANDPKIQKMIGGWHFPTSIQDQKKWLELLNCNNLDQRFAVEVDGIGIIGSTNLVSIDWKNRTAFTGAIIGDELHRGKGYGIDIVMSMMRYAFDELGMEHLDTEIIEYNEASLKTYVDHCGWVIQGTKKNWYYRDGKRWAKYILGISANEYRSAIAISKYWSKA
jgi:RimJ/RimL family protein N-acetyltransferase